MKRHFASGDSPGPNVDNLQRNFWHLALKGFRDLLQKWERYSVAEDDNKPENEDNYTDNDFMVDAAVVLILAGTSITQLLGQNVDSVRGRVPTPRDAYEQLLGHSPSEDFVKFIEVYDALRHFGHPKHDAVEAINPENLCQHLRAAQSVWCDVLRYRDEPIGDHLQNDLTFPE